MFLPHPVKLGVWGNGVFSPHGQDGWHIWEPSYLIDNGLWLVWRGFVVVHNLGLLDETHRIAVHVLSGAEIEV